MKKSINRNILWTRIFVDQLIDSGVKYACISPGSRSTPLTLAFSEKKKIKSFVIIDERSSGFFALGLAKQTNSPVVLITTSGTAVAELYPSIIEAYQLRVPLIVCTADRPPELINTGANQTIDQFNIYNNHIRHYFDAGLPETNIKSLKRIQQIASDAVLISTILKRGPVHINFPFRKPFEPDNFTDRMDTKIFNVLRRGKGKTSISKFIESNNLDSEDYKIIIEKFHTAKKGIIICGPGNFDEAFFNSCSQLAEKVGFSIFADGASSFRFTKHSKENLIVNYDVILRAINFQKFFNADLIVQFVNTPTSSSLLKYFHDSKAEKILVNEFGDIKDPSRTSRILLKEKPSIFCKQILDRLINSKPLLNGEWKSKLVSFDSAVEKIKINTIYKADFPSESRVINELLSFVPEGSKLMISNSIPIRDLDCFASSMNKNVEIYSNRGASGIDGILSTAAGIAAESKTSVFLLTGDLAFLHDMNGLWAIKNYSPHLIIILIDNNGGRLFEMLPISENKKVFEKYFAVPHNLDFSTFVKGYGGRFRNITSWSNFKIQLKNALTVKNFSVLQIRTNSKKSFAVRKRYWAKASKRIEVLLNEDHN